MAKGAVSGDISEWADVDIELVKGAFRRGIKTGAAAGGSDVATLSALKKIIPAKAYTTIQTGAFAKASTNNKMSLATFVTKDWFMKMAGGKEDQAIAMAKKMASDESAAREKEAKAPKKGDDVTSRLTDTSKYTGAHKERFGDDGKGKGKSGRVEAANNTGYVGNYKGEGTYKGDK